MYTLYIFVLLLICLQTSLECQIEDDPNASVVSVKDKVQHLNKMTSQTELQGVPQKRKDPRFSHVIIVNINNNLSFYLAF